jgi:hypothetical protein
MSLFPVNFLKYFSELPRQRGWDNYTSHQLTDSSALRFLCRDRKDSQHLNHDFDDYIAHCPRRWDASIYLKPAEKMFDAVKHVDELVLDSARIFSRLGSVSK